MSSRPDSLPWVHNEGSLPLKGCSVLSRPLYPIESIGEKKCNPKFNHLQFESPVLI